MTDLEEYPSGEDAPSLGTWEYALQAWDFLTKNADEDGIYRGSLTQIFIDLGCKPFYSHVMKSLRLMERITILHRARSSKFDQSAVQLHYPDQPLSIEAFYRVWPEVKKTQGIRRKAWQALMDQRVSDLADQLVNLSVRVDALEEQKAPPTISEEEISRQKTREALGIDDEGSEGGKEW